MTMLSLGILVVTAPAVTFDQLADRCLAVHKRATSGAFSVAFSSTGTEQNRSGTYEVGYRRSDRLRYRARMVPTAKSGPVDQSFVLNGSTLYGIDHLTHQMLQRKVVAKGTLTERFQSAIALDEPIRIAADSVGLDLFLSPLRELRGWKITERGDNRQAIATTPTGRFEITFSKSTGRLASVAIRSGAAGLRWTYSKWSSSPGSFAVPTNYRRVNEFYESPPYPKAADSATNNLLNATFAAHGRLRYANYRVTDGSGVTQVWLNDGAARQINARGEWKWSGGTLRYTKRGSAPQSRKAKLREVETTLAQQGLEIEPMLHRWLQGRNPLSMMWKPDLQARVRGEITVGKMRGSILELRSSGIRITAIIRRDSYLIHSLTTENLDRAGNVVASSERRFEYLSVGKPLPKF